MQYMLNELGQLVPSYLVDRRGPSAQFNPYPEPVQAQIPDYGQRPSLLPIAPETAPEADTGLGGLLGLPIAKTSSPAPTGGSMDTSDILMALGSGMLGLSGDESLQRLGMAGFGQIGERRKEREAAAKTNTTIEALRRMGVSEDQLDVLKSDPELLRAAATKLLIPGEAQAASSTAGKILQDYNRGLFGKVGSPEAIKMRDAQIARLEGVGKTDINITMPGGEQGTDKFFEKLQTGSADAVNELAAQLPQVQEQMGNLQTLQQLGAIMDSTTDIPPMLRKFVPEGVSTTVDAYNATAYSLAQSLRMPGMGPQTDKDFEVLMARVGSASTSPEARVLIQQGLQRAAQIKYDYAMAAQEFRLNPTVEGKQTYQQRIMEISQRRLFNDDQQAALNAFGSKVSGEIPAEPPTSLSPKMQELWRNGSLTEEMKRKLMGM